MAEHTYSVQELAAVSGVSVRTLHYYDERGLLKPAARTASNYRVYGHAEVERLQQILLYRELGFDLTSIVSILDDDGFDVESALHEQHRALRRKRARIDELLVSVEKTLAVLKGETTMSDQERFEGFKRRMVEENERTYGEEARGLWGDDAVDASNAKVMAMGEAAWERTQMIEEEMAQALRAAMEEGDLAGENARRACSLHKAWLGAFWKEGMYSVEAHRGLAEMYISDERFKAYYDKIAPGAAQFLHDALMSYYGA